MNSDSSDYVVIFCTASAETEAEAIASALTEEKLAACVQILPSINSFYRWEGRVHNDREYLMMIKTVSQNLEAVKSRIIELHSYDVPEIIALPVAGGSEKYLGWIRSSVKTEIR